jgi:flagella basal body P-ring formation protein FlgA
VLAARRYGVETAISDPPASLCVERLARSPSVEEIRAALLSALNDPAARLEIIEFSNKPLPPGHLLFSRAALNTPPANDPQTPVIWPGKFIYDDQHSLSVWAKVRISVDREVIIAKDAISKGDVIRVDQIAITRVAQFPSINPPSSSLDEIVGKVARRPIPAGQRIPPDALDEFKEVAQGQTVRVKVVDGAATIIFDGVAQSSGKKGECIFVHHPSNGKVFRARVEDRGQVLVVSAPGNK